MAQPDSNEFFDHLNPQAPRREGRQKPAPEDANDFSEVPDPFDEVNGEHPLSSSGQGIVSPEVGRARTRKPDGPGLTPGVPKPAQPPRSKHDSNLVLTPHGVKRVDDPPAEKPKPQAPEAFHDKSREKNDQDDVSWNQYAADDFPAMAAEDFGVKTKRTDSGRIVPFAIRADLTDEAIKDQSIKGGKGKRPRPAKAKKGDPARPGFWRRLGSSLRLTRPVLEEPDEPDAEEVTGKVRGRGFAPSGSMPTRKERKKKSALGVAWSVLVEVAKILMLVLLLRAYVVQVSMVQGPSMEGALVGGDRLVVERITPLLSQNKDEWWLSWLPDFLTPELKRGDIIVIRSPEDPGTELVKRLIALPGDSIKFEQGKLWIKPAGEAAFQRVHEDYLSSDALLQPDGTYRSYLSGYDLSGYIREGSEILVPAERIFVLGDNRGSSNDSRRWLEIEVRQVQTPGVDRLWVHQRSVEGRVIFRIWPLDRVWPPVK
jgi:signal peptidase I